MNWPKGPTYWIQNRTLSVSIPFTWNLKEVFQRVNQLDFWWDNVLVGGPAVELQPDYFSELPHVQVGHSSLGVLQRVNPMATRTTLGCPNRCSFCAVPKIEGIFLELNKWPDKPIICDNNLLAASEQHLDRVFDRLERHTGVDFNQGLDFRRLTDHAIERLRRLKAPRVRLACDSKKDLVPWVEGYEKLRSGGIPKYWIHTYALIGWISDPAEAWTRCEVIDKRCKVYPMWFHALDCEEHNTVTEKQKALGWSQDARIAIMRHYYKHQGEVPNLQEIANV